MPLPTTGFDRVTRRNVLKTGGLIAGGTILGGAGSVSAQPKPGPHDVHEGDVLDVGDGEVTAYASTNPAGKLSSLGVHVDGAAMAAFGDEAAHGHLHFPAETAGGDDLDLHQFTFMGFHYNPEGHPPPGIYDVPHFDFHFYMIEHDVVEEIEMGPALYSIPEAQIPEDYIRPPLVDTDDDGEPDAPLVEEEMGEHLLDATAPELQEGGEFTHTNIYGAYDPDGDGIGRLTFVEPMITVDFFDGLDEELVVEMKTPDEYFAADDYPTAYVLEPDGDGGVYVSIDDFEAFPGPSA